MILRATHVRLVFIGLLLYACLGLTSMALMNIGYALMFALGLWSLWKAQKTDVLNFITEIQTEKQIRPFFLKITLPFLVVCLSSLLYAKINPVGYSGERLEFSFFKEALKGWYLLSPFVLLILIRQINEEEKTRVVTAWVYFAGLISIVGIVQFYSGWPRGLPVPGHPGIFHATLFFGHHLSTASILIFPFFVGLTFILWNIRQKNPAWKKRIPLMIATAIMLVTLYFTWSRMLWLSLPVGLVIWVWRYLDWKKYLVFLAVVGLLMTALMQSREIRERWETTLGKEDRMVLWGASVHFFTERPLLGVGWRQSEKIINAYLQEKFGHDFAVTHLRGHSHSNLFEMLGTTGALGTLFWVLWCWWVLALAWSQRKRRDLGGALSWGIFCALIVFHLNGLTQVNFWEGKCIHQLMWATGWLLAVKKPRDTL